ncbi:hypothetical protein EI555_014071, partial [Monodon monoceros]
DMVWFFFCVAYGFYTKNVRSVGTDGPTPVWESQHVDDAQGINVTVHKSTKVCKKSANCGLLLCGSLDKKAFSKGEERKRGLNMAASNDSNVLISINAVPDMKKDQVRKRLVKINSTEAEKTRVLDYNVVKIHMMFIQMEHGINSTSTEARVQLCRQFFIVQITALKTARISRQQDRRGSTVSPLFTGRRKPFSSGGMHEPAPRKAPENRPRPRRQGRRGRNRGPVASGAATGNADARGFGTSSLPLKRRRREQGCRRCPTLRLARARPRLRPARAPDTEPSAPGPRPTPAGARPEDAEALRTAPGGPRPPVVDARRPRARGGLGQASSPPRGAREPRRGPLFSSAGPSRPEQAEPRTRRREARPSNPPRRGSPRVAAAQDSPGRRPAAAAVRPGPADQLQSSPRGLGASEEATQREALLPKGRCEKLHVEHLKKQTLKFCYKMQKLTKWRRTLQTYSEISLLDFRKYVLASVYDVDIGIDLSFVQIFKTNETLVVCDISYLIKYKDAEKSKENKLPDSYATVFATQMRSWCVKIQEQGRVISGSSMDCYNVQWDPVHRARGLLTMYFMLIISTTCSSKDFISKNMVNNTEHRGWKNYQPLELVEDKERPRRILDEDKEISKMKRKSGKTTNYESTWSRVLDYLTEADSKDYILRTDKAKTFP